MKIVLYTQRVEIVDSYNERRDCSSQKIPEFIRTCGYLPISLPNNLEIVKNMVNKLNPIGIILCGGNSLVKYGGNAPEKDMVDNYLIKTSIDKDIPLYGFCRGMQSILDYFNNKIIKVDNHVLVNHLVEGEYKSRIVNSYHTQGCVKLNNDELICIMKSEDGVIEMVKHKSYKIVGTMWHPEREYPFKKEDIKIVKDLFERKEL